LISEKLVLERLAKQEFLNVAIDALLQRYFAHTNRKDKIGRGVVHDMIANDLGIALSRDLHLLIRYRVALKGGTPSICRGRQYYRGLVKKAS
jgi:hypothetical protein